MQKNSELAFQKGATHAFILELTDNGNVLIHDCSHAKGAASTPLNQWAKESKVETMEDMRIYEASQLIDQNKLDKNLNSVQYSLTKLAAQVFPLKQGILPSDEQVQAQKTPRMICSELVVNCLNSETRKQCRPKASAETPAHLESIFEKKGMAAISLKKEDSPNQLTSLKQPWLSK